MSSGLGETKQTITYLREHNIHAVQTFLREQNGTALKYNDVDNEYYLHNEKLEIGDVIERNIYGNYLLHKYIKT